MDNNQRKREQSNAKEIINKDNKDGVQSKEIEGNDKVRLEGGHIIINSQTNGVNVLEKSNVKHMTNKERFSMMMNKEKNKSKKRKIQISLGTIVQTIGIGRVHKKVGE
jgi:hypothetical protein